MAEYALVSLLSTQPTDLKFGTTTLPARADLLNMQNNRAANGELKIPTGGVGNLVKELTVDS